MNPQEAVGNTQNEHPTPAIRTRGRWKLTLLGAVILVCGVAIGSAGTLIIRHEPPPPPKPTEFIMARMQRDLQLSAQQSKQIREILTKHFAILDAERDQLRARMDEQFRLMNDEIAKVLDQEQARKFREEFKRFGAPRPGRGGGPPGGHPYGPPHGGERPPGPPEGPPR